MTPGASGPAAPADPRGLQGLSQLSAGLWTDPSLEAGLHRLSAALTAVLGADGLWLHVHDGGHSDGLTVDSLPHRWRPLPPATRSRGRSLEGWDGRELGRVTAYFLPGSPGGDGAWSWLPLYLRLAAAFVDRWRQQHQLQVRTEALRFAIQAANAGTFSLHVASGRAEMDERSRRMSGLSHDEAASIESTLLRVHPEDRAAVVARFARLVDTPGDDRWDIEYRSVAPDGSITWIHSLGRAERGADGRAEQLRGLNIDVTARKQTEAALTRTYAELQAHASRLEQREQQLRRLASELTLAEQRSARTSLASCTTTCSSCSTAPSCG